MKKTLVQFGAGNIGRSFLGQLFSRAGYNIIFIDVDEKLISEMNEKKEYRVIIKSNEDDETILVKNISAISANNKLAVYKAIAEADFIGTSVGQRALPYIIPSIAEGLKLRDVGRPLDIIIAENLRNASQYFSAELAKNLPTNYSLEKNVGLIETSIGKMVPIMKVEDIEKDRLWVFAEAYNNLIVDAKAFKQPIPNVPGLAPKEKMKAFVDRKLFIHNLGHAALAYLGYKFNPKLNYSWEVLANKELYIKIRKVMFQSAKALLCEYPDVFTINDLEEHIDDLLMRFQNKSLGDTVFRIGRDLNRKLNKNDRVLGAICLADKHSCKFNTIIEVFHAALEFTATDENNEPLKEDFELLEKAKKDGIKSILLEISGLSEENDIKIIEAISKSIGLKD